MIAGVFLFILIPFVVAVLLSVFRRLQTIATFVATGVAGALGVAALWLPLDQVVQLGGRQIELGEPVTLLGRQLVMTSANSVLLGFMFLAAAGLFLVGWRSIDGSLLFPVGMATLGFLSAALVVRPFLYAALALTIGSVLATLLFASHGQTRGASRYLALTTLALPAFMIASWMVDLYAPNPIDVTLPRNIMLALAGGFALLLGVVPFHIWIRPVADESPPVAAIFVLSVCNSANWFLLLNVLQEFPWLVTQQDIFRGLQLLGLLTTLAGGILAYSSHDFAHVLAYGVMADYGSALLTLGTRTPAGLSAVMFATLARPASLALLALGLTLARDRFQSSRFDKLTGLGWSNPWMAAALTVGGFSLAGIPPLAGFLGRWSEVRLLAAAQPLYVAAVLGATLGVAAGALRGMDFLLQPPPASATNPAPAGSQRTQEPRLMIVLVVFSVLAGLALALFPGAIEPYVRTVVSSYTFLSIP
jgi:NADH:ubiquinone oxidoreductase subunit 2 (subunit N)